MRNVDEDIIRPSDTEGDVLTTVGGEAVWVPGGGGPVTAVFKYAGALTAGVGATRLYNDTGSAWTIASVRASVESAPSGNTLTVDVNRNGVTIFTAQANRPTIPAGSLTSGKITNMDVTTVNDGDYLTIDVDVAASAANLSIVMVLT